MLSSKVYKWSDNSIGYVRQNDIDSIRHEELALKLAKKQGYVTRKNIAELFHVSEPQAYRLLAALTQKGDLELFGKGRYSKYIIQK
jgi:ATP-dependent DNA helicase RecG